MNFKMKTAMFKVFATCIATLCITLPVPSRAAPVLSSVPVKSEEKDENPIKEKHLDKKLEILDVLKFVDLKSFDSELIANEVLRELAIKVHEQMMAPGEFRRQRRSFNPEVESRLRKEFEKDDFTLSMPVDSKKAVPLMPSKSNEDKNSQQSNENEKDGEVHELPDPPSSSEQDNSVHESNEESDHPQESNESKNSQDSDEVDRPPKNRSYEFELDPRNDPPIVDDEVPNDGPKNPQEPNEPKNPQEPNEPNNPQEPNEPNNPQEPNKPNNPQEPNEPNNPQESNEPNNPRESNEPKNPQEPNEPNNPQESNESKNPQESNEPNNPQESNEPKNPQESNEPNNPQESNEPKNPQESNEDADIPKESNESDRPSDSKSHEFETDPRNDPTNNDDEEKVPDDEPEPPSHKI